MKPNRFTLPATLVLSFAIGALISPITQAQQSGVYAYPGAGQTAEQQKGDDAACRQWATEQTGFDPRRNAPPEAMGQSYGSSSSSGGLFAYGSGEAGQGGVVGDSARGAATGAMLGAIAGNAGAGAAYGALGGAVFGGMKRSSRQAEEQRYRQQQQAQLQQQQAQMQHQYQLELQGYRQAWGACMSSRNYRVQ